MFTEISCCRICHNTSLITIFDLGLQSLGSRFPALQEQDPLPAPLVLVKCNDTVDQSRCGLLQLKHSVCENELYLQHYGYRSGLNNTMINHLSGLVSEIKQKIELLPNDLVLDIGSNDCTLLKEYNQNLQRVGIDPTGTQFKQYYPQDVFLIPDFFTAEVFTNKFGHQKAKVITTVSMFYDLPDPIGFAKNIKNILDDNGIWVTEQSYCVTMLENNSFDTICHEHLEYYTLKQLQYIATAAQLKIIDVSLNDCNGGSFRVTLTHDTSSYPISEIVKKIMVMEDELALHTLNPLTEFITRCESMKIALVDIIKEKVLNNKSIYLYGASTKGNTLLQYYGLDNTLITAAAERNPEKYGRRTPGTNIPIIPEDEMRQQNPDLLLVLPWHFKKEFLEREKLYLQNGGTIIFPMPQLDIYTQDVNLK